MTQFYYHWKNRPAAGEFRTGISLHGHTSRSEESLTFLPGAVQNTVIAPIILHWAERRHYRKWKVSFDYSRGYWTSPVSPTEAYSLEAKQISGEGLMPIVSLTDHDEIKACKELRDAGTETPVSLEWTVPYKTAVFHVGLHNIPADKADSILQTARDYTAHPDDATLGKILSEIHAHPETLIILNHPLSDQGRIGHEIHASMVDDFLAAHGKNIHALEINALQPWEMNRRVAKIGDNHAIPLVAGGDRHGFEPNGAINLTNAKTFSEFAHAIRTEKKNSILFMPQCNKPLTLRYAESVEAIMAYYPNLQERAAWHDRVFYRCPDGVTRSLTQMIGKRFYALDITSMAVNIVGFTINQVIKPIAPIFTNTEDEEISG